MDYYATLGVSKTASDQEIKSAYRRLALQYHPDKNPSPDAKHKFQELTHAYSVLIDSEKRYNYDHGINDDDIIDFDDFMAHLDPDFFRDLGFPSGMEFLGPLLAMGLFADMHKSSSGESVEEDEMKSFMEFTENNTEIRDGKYCCKICGRKFATKDATVKHIGNKHHEIDEEEDD